MRTKLMCHVRELIEQFIPETLNEEMTFHVLLHPFTLHSLAKGHSLKFFAA